MPEVNKATLADLFFAVLYEVGVGLHRVAWSEHRGNVPVSACVLVALDQFVMAHQCGKAGELHFQLRLRWTNTPMRSS